LVLPSRRSIRPSGVVTIRSRTAGTVTARTCGAAHGQAAGLELHLGLVRDQRDLVELGLAERMTDEPPIVGHADHDRAAAGHRHGHHRLEHVVGRRLELELLVLDAAETAPECAAGHALTAALCPVHAQSRHAQQLSGAAGRHGSASEQDETLARCRPIRLPRHSARW